MYYCVCGLVPRGYKAKLGKGCVCRWEGRGLSLKPATSMCDGGVLCEAGRVSGQMQGLKLPTARAAGLVLFVPC